MKSKIKNIWQRIRRGFRHEDDYYSETNPGFHSPNRLRNTLIGCALVGVAVGGWLIFWLQSSGILTIDESKLQVIIEYQHSDNSLVFDREGRKIGEFFSNYHVFHPYAKLPKKLVEAVIAIEDRNFFEHRGIDVRGIFRAFLASLKTGRFTQGGSTLTQQVVRNFLLTPEKKVSRKIKEVLFALRLEQYMSKEKILEIYLNALFLGQGAYGAGAAAERHFGKPLDQLEVHELALIAGLFQSPSRYNPHRFPKAARARQQQVLHAMLRSGYLTPADYQYYKRRPIEFKQQASANAVPYFVDTVQEQVEKLLDGKVKGRGLRITTTLDLELQKKVDDVIVRSRDIFELAAQRLVNVKNPDSTMIEAASLVMDHKTGEILAMVGGRDFQRSQFNRALKAKRAPGSSFKPIIYSLALMNGANWSDVAYVSPIVIQNYRPQNHGNEFMTETTLYAALYKSINTPVVELGSKLGIRKVMELAKKMGVRTELKPQAGTLLGGSETTLLDMASVYGTIGNYGEKLEPFMISRITDRDGQLIYERKPSEPERVLPPTIAYLMIDGLQSVFRFGTAARFPEFASWAAGKTGTSNDAKDNWFCGMSRDLTAVVWVGTDENYAFSGSVGANTLALPIWARIMERLKERKKPEPFEVPEGIHYLQVNSQFGFIDVNGINMPFLEGRGPTREGSSLSVIRETGSFRDVLDW